MKRKTKIEKQAYFVIGGLVILAALILYLILCLVTGETILFQIQLSMVLKLVI